MWSEESGFDEVAISETASTLRDMGVDDISISEFTSVAFGDYEEDYAYSENEDYDQEYLQDCE